MSNKKLAIDWLETVLISEPYSEEDFEHNERCWEQAKVMEEDGKHESYLYGHKVGFTKAKEMEKEQKGYSEEDMKQFGLYLGDNLKKLKGKSIDELFTNFKQEQ